MTRSVLLSTMSFSRMCAISNCLPPCTKDQGNANYPSYITFRLIWKSRFKLEGALKQHFWNYMNEYSIFVQKIQKDMYVENLVSSRTNIAEVENLKQKSVELFSKGGFNLRKWHSNIPSLENDNTNSKQTYAKQLFSSNSAHTKILRLGWNKITEKINIEIPQFIERQITKRNELSDIASIYNPLGSISASYNIRKRIYRELCDLKIHWEEVIADLKNEKKLKMSSRYK